MSMSEDSKIITVKLRVPPDLRDRIADSAKALNRSMNADMVARLEASFAEPQSLIKPTVVANAFADIAADLRQTVEQLRTNLSEARTEAREMQMLYVEALAKNLKTVPLDQDSELAQKILEVIQQHEKCER